MMFSLKNKQMLLSGLKLEWCVSVVVFYQMQKNLHFGIINRPLATLHLKSMYQLTAIEIKQKKKLLTKWSKCAKQLILLKVLSSVINVAFSVLNLKHKLNPLKFSLHVT